jgi:hypothetical protein
MMGADLPSSSLYSTVEHNMEIESIRAHNWGRFRAEKKDSNKDLTSYIAKINRAKGRPRLAIGCVVKSALAQPIPAVTHVSRYHTYSFPNMEHWDPMVRGSKGGDDPPSRRGIGSAFADSAAPLLHPPPSIANFFHHNDDDDGGDHRGKNNGGINVDNIFASMTEDDEECAPGGNNANNCSNIVGNTIFHNFASMSNENGSTLTRHDDDRFNHLRQRAIASPFSSVAPGIPIRKYSDYTNYYSSSRDVSVIPATSTTTQVNNYYVGSNANHGDGDDNGGRMPFCRSESNDVLSKSVGTTSLRLASRVMTEGYEHNMCVFAFLILNPLTSHNQFHSWHSRSEPDPTPTIRHAGYLLKRSNVPYMPYVVPGDEYSWGGIAPLPDLSSDLSREKEYGNTHFNGFESSGVSNMLSPERVFENPASSMAKVDSTSVTGISSEECITSIDEEKCFCSPIAKYFKQMFDNKRPMDALIAGKGTNGNKNHESMSVPRGMTPPVSPAINQYKMPLKSPARSDPVPISPAGDHRATLIPRPRSFSTITSPFVATGEGTNTQPRKEYPLPPPDYIDPKDGHIWRSKYCILEEGILYFYRTAEEGESDEARTERYEHRLYSEELEDIVLGEELVISSSRQSFTGQKRWSMLSTEDRKSSHDIYDLSKSPMPQRKSDLLGFHGSPFHRQGSSVLIGQSDGAAGDDEGSFRRAIHHTNSVGTFNNDADILWEKRVALDCVGAVRSSEQEHGIHAFELLAYGCGGPDDDTASTFRGGGRKDEIIDRLILRASSSDDRNAWMFQFHRSLTSFVMQRFVIKSAAAVRGNRLGGMRPDSPNNRGGQQRLRLPSDGAAGKGGFIGSPFVAKSSFMMSPSGNNSFGGTSFSPHVVGSLSHGHGRNALYRRKVRDGKNVYGDASVASVVSPLQTPAGTPRGGSSPVESMPSMIMIQSDSARLQNKVELPSLKGLREGGKKKDGRMSPATPSASAAPQKYVPPHMRKKLASSSGGDEASSTTKKLKDNQLPSTDEATEQTEMGNASPTTPVVSSGSLGGSLSDSPLSSSSLLSGQVDDSEDFAAASIRLGGCADPKVVVGSIIDHQYIDRKASVVGNARLEAYGGTGGGNFRRIRHYRAEDESTPLDDLGVNMLESKTVALKWEVGASSECGVRNSNEDSFIVINNLDNLMKSQGLVSFSQQDLGQTKQQGMYAIFDGHVGNQAAR